MTDAVTASPPTTAPTPPGTPDARSQDSDTDYTLVGRSVWISAGPFSVHVIRTDEGVVADIYARGRELEPCLAGTYAYDDEAA
jgi:hypothetical protein